MAKCQNNNGLNKIKSIWWAVQSWKEAPPQSPQGVTLLPSHCSPNPRPWPSFSGLRQQNLHFRQQDRGEDKEGKGSFSRHWPEPSHMTARRKSPFGATMGSTENQAFYHPLFKQTHNSVDGVGIRGWVLQRVACWSPRSSVLCISQGFFAGGWQTDESARLLK